MLCGSRVFANKSDADGGTRDFSDSRLPKKINSRRIDSFSYSFDNHSAVCPDDEALTGGAYRLGLQRIDVDKAKMTIGGSNRFGDDINIEAEVPADSLERLQEIIERQGLASVNGWHKRSSALGRFSLNVVYDSKEIIKISGQGGFMVIPDCLKSYPYLKLFKDLAEASGYDFTTGEKKPQDQAITK